MMPGEFGEFSKEASGNYRAMQEFFSTLLKQTRKQILAGEIPKKEWKILKADAKEALKLGKEIDTMHQVAKLRPGRN